MCEVNAHFPGYFTPMILANCFRLNARRSESSEKCAITFHNYISVMDKVKINEQKVSIATGPLYVLTKFEVI